VDNVTDPVLPLLWLVCGGSVVVAALRSRRHADAVRQGRLAVGALFIVAGAAVNAFLVVRDPDSYAKFAEASYLPFVRHTWATLVVPHTTAWITLLIAFELAVGALALLGDWKTRLGYAAAMGFHIALLTFGFGFYLWSVPMLAALTTLSRAEGRKSHEEVVLGRARGGRRAQRVRV
jgi:hypothetical protein